jgi:hypothetical protein
MREGLAMGAIAATLTLAAPTSEAAAPWRAGWSDLRNPTELLNVARELGFNAIITQGPSEKLEAFAKQAKEVGVEVYLWTNATAGKGEEALAQQMSPEEDALWAKLKADTDPKKHGYQFGGEPLEGHREVLQAPPLCLDRPEAMEAFTKRVRAAVDACPSLGGVAFDFIGYQNYHCCHCPATERLFQAWHKTRAQLPPDKARDEFSLERLVWYYEQLSDYVRSLRPGLKLTAHIYPAFLPEPLYGNRLKLDYSIQTVAWFFEPYWPEVKVRQYARAIRAEEGKYHANARGIPFVGLYVQRPIADKPVERFAREVKWVFGAAGGTSLSIYDFGAVVSHEAHRRALKEALARAARDAGAAPQR